MLWYACVCVCMCVCARVCVCKTFPETSVLVWEWQKVYTSCWSIGYALIWIESILQLQERGREKTVALKGGDHYIYMCS